MANPLIKNWLGWLVIVSATSTTAGCSGQDAANTSSAAGDSTRYVVFAEFADSPEDSLPRLRFLESGLLSINDRCPVRKVRLNPKMPPAWVNGRPVGFC